MVPIQLNANLKLHIAAAVSQYLQQQGGILVIFLKQTDGCCAGAILNPCCEVGRPPSNLADFHHLKLTEFELYISNEACLLSGVLEMKLERLLWWRLLSIRLIK